MYPIEPDSRRVVEERCPPGLKSIYLRINAVLERHGDWVYEPTVRPSLADRDPMFPDGPVRQIHRGAVAEIRSLL